MTTTQEISSTILAALDLHKGDSLQVIEERGDKVLVQIARSNQTSEAGRSMTAGEWARKYAGSLKLKDGQTLDDLRIEHMREKFGMQ